MKILHATLQNVPRSLGGGDGNQISMTLAERVVYLVQDRRQRTVPVMTEIHTDRVEAVPEHARHRQQTDRPAREVDAGMGQMMFHPAP